MSSRIADMSQRQAALVAGLAYVAIIVLAFFANFFVLGGLVEPDDAAATVSNIADSEALFRGGVAAFMLVFAMDVVATWGLYVFFRRTSRELSLFAASFRLVTAAISEAALLNLLVVAKLAGGTGYTTAFGAGQRNGQVMLFLDAYTYGWAIALVCFGFHLLLLGYLIVKSGYAPRILGVLVVVAGLGYVVANLARVLFPGYEDHEGLFLLLLAVVSIPGEFGLTGWLLWRGRRLDLPAARPDVSLASG